MNQAFVYLSSLGSLIIIIFNLESELQTEKITSKITANETSEIPKLILVVSSVGASLLLLNIILVVCFIKQKAMKKHNENGNYDKLSIINH